MPQTEPVPSFVCMLFSNNILCEDSSPLVLTSLAVRDGTRRDYHRYIHSMNWVTMADYRTRGGWRRSAL